MCWCFHLPRDVNIVWYKAAPLKGSHGTIGCCTSLVENHYCSTSCSQHSWGGLLSRTPCPPTPIHTCQIWKGAAYGFSYTCWTWRCQEWPQGMIPGYLPYCISEFCTCKPVGGTASKLSFPRALGTHCRYALYNLKR